MSRWFRMYADVLDDPKVQKLPPPLFKAWVNLLCLASRHGGVLPEIGDIAFALRADENVTRDIIRDLVGRGLIDEGDALSPHNWDGRQFKSDQDDTASERKRAQRERDKERKKGSVTPPVTSDVTRDNDVTSHPPEQNRSDQIITQQNDARDSDPRHWKEVQGILDGRLTELSRWEEEFLLSIKWAETLSKAQADKLKAISDRMAARDPNAKPYALPTVTRGTPAYDAWIAHYRRQSRTGKTFHEQKDSFTVPSEFPPEERAA